MNDYVYNHISLSIHWAVCPVCL